MPKRISVEDVSGLSDFRLSVEIAERVGYAVRSIPMTESGRLWESSRNGDNRMAHRSEEDAWWELVYGWGANFAENLHDAWRLLATLIPSNKVRCIRPLASIEYILQQSGDNLTEPDIIARTIAEHWLKAQLEQEAIEERGR